MHRPERADQAGRLMAAAAQALGAGDAAGARERLRRAVEFDPGALPAWLNLAAACNALADLDGAMAAIEGALKLDPRNFLALLGKARVLERQGKARPAAIAYGVALAQAPPDDRLDAGALKAVRRAREVSSRYTSDLEAFIHTDMADQLGRTRGAEARRIGAFVEIALRKRRSYPQQPVEFHYPGLPAIEFYERDEFPWLEQFEASTDAIREELLAILREDAGRFVPYVDYPDSVPLDQWRELNHSLRWGAYHLLAQGERVEENCRRCPSTLEALARIPQPQVQRRSPAAMFSALQPRTRIPPHTGIANTRLVVHLPLVVPAGCGFRVGGETREWREGEDWVFDDTIEHEAWNDSDDVRVILICDIWSPRLSEDERTLIAGVMAAMDRFNDAQPSPGL